MGENIELRSFRTIDVQDGDIEEYHEIEEIGDTSNVENVPQSISRFEFFTRLEPKSNKKVEKKRKHKKKQKEPNTLMDIISSELASISVPLKENVIEIAEERELSASYLEKFTAMSQDRRVFHRTLPFMEQDYGYRLSSKYIKLRPMFPRIIENTAVSLPPDIPVEYVEPASFDDLVSYSESNDDKQAKFLEIQMKDIVFKHHHKYSLENVLVLKLIELFNEYKDLEKNLYELRKDIKIGRDTKNNLKRELLKASPNKGEQNIRFDETLRKYINGFLELKEKYKNIVKKRVEIIHVLVSLWSDIEAVREKSGHIQTPYSLLLKKEVLSKNDYDTEWNQAYEVEFTDALDKIEYDFVTKYLEYKELKNSLDASKKLSKPKMRVDEEEIKKEVFNLLNYIVRREVVTFELKLEENMKLKTKRNNYLFEIYVDDLFVCESEQYKSDDAMFNTNFEDIFSVEILPQNNKLAFVLKENDEKVAIVIISIPRALKHKDNFVRLLFDYKIDIEPNTHYAGSGYTIKEIAAINKVRLKSCSIFKDKLTTACEVGVKIGWSSNLQQNQEDAIKEFVDTGNMIKRLLHGIDSPNLETLIDVIGKVYGKDISNDEDMIQTLKTLFKRNLKSQNKFPIDENSPDFIRLKLLHLRNKGGFVDVEDKRIPINGSEVTTEHLNCLQKTKEKDFDMEYLKEKEFNMDPIELQRFIAAKYIQKLNKKMIMNLNEHLMVKTQKDVVREFKDFSLRALFSGNDQGFSASLPNSKKQELLAESMTKEQDIYVTVVRAFNLLNRSNDLFDDGENANDMEIAENVSGFKVQPLRPFVRVSYHGIGAQTVTAIGCHPSWNHTLKINSKLDPLGSLQINIYDECKVNLTEGSDEQSTTTIHYRHFNKWLGTTQVPLFTVLSLGALRGTFKVTSPPVLFGYESQQNMESSSFIPEITRLLKRDTSYITLNITTSLSHLGGIQAYNQPLPSTAEDDYVIKYLNNFVSAYINDFPERVISLTFIDSGGRNKCVTQFLQPIPLPGRDYFPKNPKTCGSALSKSSGVSRSSSSKSSGRKRDVDLEANDEKESEYSHVSWRSGDSLVKMINASMRYVALIPGYEVTETHTVTLMGLELLKVLYGTPLDHCILLASYFLYLGIKCYISIGLGLPRGRSSYVLIQYDLASKRFVTTDQVVRSRGFLERKEAVTWYVCDAVNGERYELRDVGCPMKTVDYVFDNDNIWVNVQSSSDCENLAFDFTKSSDWQPVFDKSIFVMKHPIVNDANLYSPPGDMESLRQALEAKIKGKVQKWRTFKKTIWNRYCSGLLREALAYWEYWTFNQNEAKPGFSQKMKQLMATYRIYGFPLNLPFSNTKSVISAIKSTGVHVNEDPNVEFGLAVDVYGYPNNVLSVWVFLVNIARI